MEDGEIDAGCGGCEPSGAICTYHHIVRLPAEMVSCGENPRLVSSQPGLKFFFIKMEMRVVFLALISALFVNSRYIQETDEMDLEAYLEDYYDDLVYEYKSIIKELQTERQEAKHVKNIMNLVAKEKTDLREESNLEAKIDVDYMADEAVKVRVVFFLVWAVFICFFGFQDEGNFALNGSVEDPMLAKAQRERWVYDVGLFIERKYTRSAMQQSGNLKVAERMSVKSFRIKTNNYLVCGFWRRVGQVRSDISGVLAAVG